MTDAAFWVVARRVCTSKELEALELHRRHGFGQRQVAYALGISRASVRERIENADRKIERELRHTADVDGEAA